MLSAFRPHPGSTKGDFHLQLRFPHRPARRATSRLISPRPARNERGEGEGEGNRRPANVTLSGRARQRSSARAPSYLRVVARMNLHETIAVPNHPSTDPNPVAGLRSIRFRQLDVTETNLCPEIPLVREGEILAVDLKRLQLQIHRIELVGGFCGLLHPAADFAVIAQISPADDSQAF